MVRITNACSCQPYCHAFCGNAKSAPADGLQVKRALYGNIWIVKINRDEIENFELDLLVLIINSKMY